MSESTANKSDFASAAEAAFAEMPDVQALLRFNPADFGSDKPNNTDTAPAESPPASPGAEEPASSSEPEGGKATAPTPAPANVDPEIERMKGFMRALEVAARAAPQPQPQPQQPPEPQLPQYAYDISDNLLKALTSDDLRERQQAVMAFAVNLSQTVHSRAVRDMEERIAAVMPQFVNAMIMQEIARREVARDFYGTYPEFNRPELTPVVAHVAQQVMQEVGNEGWTPRVRDMVATRTRALLSAVQGSVQQQNPRPAPQMTPQTATPMAQNAQQKRNILQELGLE